MIKKVLLFHHFDVCNNLFNNLNDGLCAELKKRNILCEYVDITKDEPSVIRDLTDKIDESFDMAIAFNSRGQQNLMQDGENIFDKYHIPFFNWIVDHPIDLGGFEQTTCQNFYVLCMDRIHESFIKSQYPSVKDAFYLPLPGLASASDTLLPIEDRAYDIVFSGSLSEPLDEQLQVFNSYPSPNKEILLSLIDYSIQNTGTDITEAVDIVLRDRFGVTDVEGETYRQILSLASVANRFLKSYFREKVLHSLIQSDIRLHIFGDRMQDRLGVTSANTVFHDSVDFYQTASIFGNSKIVLNVMPCFKSGSHDRLPSTMLNGAVALTDHSRYLDTLPPEILCFYDINDIDALPGIVRKLLNDTNRLQQIADNGNLFAQKNFTWEPQLDKIIQITTGLHPVTLQTP